VRGLDYYTRTVFEVVSWRSAQDASSAAAGTHLVEWPAPSRSDSRSARTLQVARARRKRRILLVLPQGPEDPEARGGGQLRSIVPGRRGDLSPWVQEGDGRANALLEAAAGPGTREDSPFRWERSGRLEP
jgi:hypothetical protein